MSEFYNSFAVRVYCATYNHERYIIDALNGFVMQRTNFPVVYTIVDDASTDNTAAVIQQFVNENFDLDTASAGYDKVTDYGCVTFAPHKTNKNCYFAVIYLKENHYSRKKSKAPYLSEWMDAKYVALCEGDDYWTDPLKLQKQVDFLEEHPDYSLCCHERRIYYQNEKRFDDDNSVKKMLEANPGGFSFGNKENLNMWIARTLTLVYRHDCYDENELKKYKFRCDVHDCYHLLKKGKGWCLPFVGAVYRVCDSGVYSGLSEKETLVRWCRMRTELLNYNLEDKDLRDNVFCSLRYYLYEHKTCKEMFGVMAVCVKSFYHTEGFKGAVKSKWKMLKSFVCGFCVKKA